MSKKLHNQGFTLIELLVVITIIAILASISVPVYNGVTARANQTKASKNVNSIIVGCMLFSIDYEGSFPTGRAADVGAGDSGAGEGSTSTEAFDELIPDYIDTEKIFFTPGQAPSSGKRIPNEDNNLSVAENCFAYVIGLSTTSSGRIPLVADWFTAGGSSYDDTHVWWEMGNAIVGRCDGSIKTEKVTKKGGGYVLGDDKQSNLFGVRGEGEQSSGSGGMIPSGVTIANP